MGRRRSRQCRRAEAAFPRWERKCTRVSFCVYVEILRGYALLGLGLAEVDAVTHECCAMGDAEESASVLHTAPGATRKALTLLLELLNHFLQSLSLMLPNEASPTLARRHLACQDNVDVAGHGLATSVAAADRVQHLCVQRALRQ